MTTILNASTSSGFVVTADNSGTFAFQTNGTQYNPVLNSGTSVASTSGTSIAFTGIPSYVKRITVMFNGVSLSGSSNFLIQLGTGATPTYTTSGYVSFGVTFSSSGLAGATSSSGFNIGQTGAAANTYGGNCMITTSGSNLWTSSAVLGGATNVANGGFIGGGSVSLGAALTAVLITTVNGTDTFDAGSINILYE